MEIVSRSTFGFHNIGGAKKAAQEAGCHKPLIVTDGVKSREYKACMERAAATKADVQLKEAEALAADAKSAPERAIAAAKLAEAEASKVEAELIRSQSNLSPTTKVLLIGGALVFAGVITLIAVKMS